MAASLESLMTAILILLTPVFLAIPLSLGWKWWVGTEPEHVHYREKVRLVLDAGLPLSRFRKELDSEARIVNIDPESQSRIESDLLFPMRVKHFLYAGSSSLAITWIVCGTSNNPSNADFMVF